MLGMIPFKENNPHLFSKLYNFDSSIQSFNVAWFDEMDQKTNIYDLTAYILLRDQNKSPFEITKVA
jgi:hypothetical protein